MHLPQWLVPDPLLIRESTESTDCQLIHCRLEYATCDSRADLMTSSAELCRQVPHHFLRDSQSYSINREVMSESQVGQTFPQMEAALCAEDPDAGHGNGESSTSPVEHVLTPDT